VPPCNLVPSHKHQQARIGRTVLLCLVRGVRVDRVVCDVLRCVVCLLVGPCRKQGGLDNDLAHSIEVEQRIREGAERMRRAAMGNKKVSK
jgi:hypothetical protein